MVLPHLLPTAKAMMIVDVDCIFMNDFEYSTTATYFPRKPSADLIMKQRY